MNNEVCDVTNGSIDVDITDIFRNKETSDVQIKDEKKESRSCDLSLANGNPTPNKPAPSECNKLVPISVRKSTCFPAGIDVDKVRISFQIQPTTTKVEWEKSNQTEQSSIPNGQIHLRGRRRTNGLHKPIEPKIVKRQRDKWLLLLKRNPQLSPLAVPMHEGWKRTTRAFWSKKFERLRETVTYFSPSGKKFTNMDSLAPYLRIGDEGSSSSRLCVKYFSFEPRIHCLDVLEVPSKDIAVKDFSKGKEALGLSVLQPIATDVDWPRFTYVSYYCRTPTVTKNFNKFFSACCDCPDDCQDKLNCPCFQLTWKNRANDEVEINDAGYSYKMLYTSFGSGIYECNKSCKCQNTCHNRVVQHPAMWRFQLFHTRMKGWGIRTLTDIPKGSFVSNYLGKVMLNKEADKIGSSHRRGKWRYFASLSIERPPSPTFNEANQIETHDNVDIPESNSHNSNSRSLTPHDYSLQIQNSKNCKLSKTPSNGLPLLLSPQQNSPMFHFNGKLDVPHGSIPLPCPLQKDFNGLFSKEKGNGPLSFLPFGLMNPSIRIHELSQADISQSSVKMEPTSPTSPQSSVMVQLTSHLNSLTHPLKRKRRNQAVKTIFKPSETLIPSTSDSDSDFKSLNEKYNCEFKDLRIIANHSFPPMLNPQRKVKRTRKVFTWNPPASVEPQKSNTSKCQLLNATKYRFIQKFPRKSRKKRVFSFSRQRRYFSTKANKKLNVCVPLEEYLKDAVIDGRVHGNLSRFFNHSCDPNLFPQHVFVDTHNKNFPWLSLFALRNIKAGEELTWNYNYSDKKCKCNCGFYNCTGFM